MNKVKEVYTKYYIDDGHALITSEKQRAIAEELCIDPVKFDRVICDFTYSLSQLFHDGDEPLNGEETRAVAECVLDMLDYIHGS